MMAGFGMVGLLLMLFFWVGVIAIGVWLVKAIFSGNSPTSTSFNQPGSSARDLLDRRYARGEITREQYQLIKQDLEEDH